MGAHTVMFKNKRELIDWIRDWRRDYFTQIKMVDRKNFVVNYFTQFESCMGEYYNRPSGSFTGD